MHQYSIVNYNMLLSHQYFRSPLYCNNLNSPPQYYDGWRRHPHLQQQQLGIELNTIRGGREGQQQQQQQQQQLQHRLHRDQHEERAVDVQGLLQLPDGGGREAIQ